MGTFAGTRTMGGRAEAEIGRFVTGVEVYERNWTAVTTMRMSGVYMDQASVPGVAMTVAGAFAQYSAMLGRGMRLVAGARLDGGRSEARSDRVNRTLYRAYKDTGAVSASDVLPSASVWLTVPVRGAVEAFIGLGRTTRLPDPQERFFALQRMGSDWVGNPGLRATANTEIDAGFSYRGRRVTLRPTLFYSNVSDMITVHNQRRLLALPGIMNTAARSFDNVDARLYGGELSTSLEVTRALLLSAGAAYSRGLKNARPELRIFDRDIAELPPLRGRAGLRYGTSRFYAESEWAGSWRQTLVDADVQEAPTPGYGLVNLKAGVRTSAVKLSFGIDNLLDRYYYEHTSYQRDPFRIGVRVPEPGRSFFLMCAFSF